MIDLAKVERVMGLMLSYGIESVNLESSSEKIILTKSVGSSDGLTSVPTPKVNLTAKPQDSLPVPSPLRENTSKTVPLHSALSEPAPLPEGTVVTSPFVGTFYRSPNPESPSFVEKGARISKGQVLCIVEAMKLMNEIEAELDGEIVAILVENAKPVEFGTPLFIVK